MTHIVSTASVEHYQWGENCDGWHLLKRDDVSIIQERVPPGGAEVQHLHRHARQFFFVLSGEATLEINALTFVLHAQDGIEVPPGVPHQFSNESASEVVFLVVSWPPSHRDREMA
ncbi:MAG: cupin domain-containing protein [Deltaproteobacteria bacterium]|nr:cupin domain-containing protein [Deltaproteobacteria bacterium]